MEAVYTYDSTGSLLNIDDVPYQRNRYLRT